jgi:hypothetical protein
MFRVVMMGLAVAILLTGPSRVAFADQKSDDILTLLHLTDRDTDNLMRADNRPINAVMRRLMAGSPNLTNAQDEQLETAARDISARYIAAVETHVRSYYYEHLSDAHIKATIAFLKSPDGQAYLEVSKSLRQSIDSDARQQMPGMVQDLVKSFKSILNGGVVTPPTSKAM